VIVPLPLPALAVCSQLFVVEAVHAQPPGAVIVTLSLLSVAEYDALVAESE
jgi:hypothetical protein